MSTPIGAFNALSKDERDTLVSEEIERRDIARAESRGAEYRYKYEGEGYQFYGISLDKLSVNCLIGLLLHANKNRFPILYNEDDK